MTVHPHLPTSGNRTTYATYGLTFDAENRLTEYKTSGNTVLLTAGYTGDGLRAWKDTDANAANGRTYFLYDGGTLLAEMDASGTLTAANTWGANGLLSRRVSSTTTYYAYDPQGSVAARLNSAGTTVSTDLYDAYGSLLAGGASDPYGYCGQWGYYRDSDTGKVLCTFRYYDPNAGRWLTRDPIGYQGGVNLYGYVKGSPTTWGDPFGLAPGDDYPSRDAAGKAAIRDCLPRSIQCDREYAGSIYTKPNGQYTYSNPNVGGRHDSVCRQPPPGAPLMGYYHTHGAESGPNWDDENPSDVDKRIADGVGRPMYLGTPSGTIKKYQPVPGGPMQGPTVPIGRVP